ncbi:MAG: hypothetical protein RI575_15285, partial [Balneolaceae bacterium]|nr:hypothetical protein [Balneolaceae bacterium]
FFFQLKCSFCQSFPQLNFKISDSYEFKIISTHEIESGKTTLLISDEQSVKGRNLVLINHIDMNLKSVSESEFLDYYRKDYEKRGIDSVIKEINNKNYIIAGEVSNITEVYGTENYSLYATTFHNGDAYGIAVQSTFERQVDWVFKIAEDIEFFE